MARSGREKQDTSSGQVVAPDAAMEEDHFLGETAWEPRLLAAFAFRRIFGPERGPVTTEWFPLLSVPESGEV